MISRNLLIGLAACASLLAGCGEDTTAPEQPGAPAPAATTPADTGDDPSYDY